MKVLVTGADGFIGKNLIACLNERGNIDVLKFTRNNNIVQLAGFVSQVELVFHLAGVNRPQNPLDFKAGNTDLTQALAAAIKASDNQTSVLYTSSTQAELDNPYGRSKRAAEEVLIDLANNHGSKIHIFRLPNVFGKWAKPNYNSVVATFCHNIARDLPIQINDPEALLKLVYIDDVVASFINVMDKTKMQDVFVDVSSQYSISLGELAELLRAFRVSRESLVTQPVGAGLIRALYSTYVSYIPPERFSYKVPDHSDDRGVFVEMLKTKDSGQFSYFTAHPGVTRGGHYHHSKTEKFLVIKGNARFRFRHIVSGEFHEVTTSGERPEIVETVPGWTHDITNIGNEEMIVMLWANEIFDRERPDTYPLPVCP